MMFSKSLGYLLILAWICFLCAGCGDESAQKIPQTLPASPQSAPPQLGTEKTSGAEKLTSETGSSTLEAIKQRGELRVGMQVGYIPFQMAGNGGSVIGFDADMAEMAAKSLKVALRIVRNNWQELIPSLVAGNADVVISGMTITPERNAEAMFTIPVLETGRMFLVHSMNAERFKRMQDLNQRGVFVVSVPGGLGDLRLKELLPDASYREFPDRAHAAKEVLERRAHAYIDEEFAIRLACATHSQFLTSNFTLLSFEPMAWAVRPNDPHWLNWLNHFIRQVKGDGRLEESKKKWLHDYFLDLRAPG